MKKALLFFVLLLLSFYSHKTSAQEILKPNNELGKFKSTVYASFLGPTIMIGINYDMRLRRGSQGGLGFRVGAGGAGSFFTVGDGIDITTFPVGINYLSGKSKKHFIVETGLLPMYSAVRSSIVLNKGFQLGGTYLLMGYRYQSLAKGFMWQIAWSPFFVRNMDFYPLYLELGIGYTFN